MAANPTSDSRSRKSTGTEPGRDPKATSGAVPTGIRQEGGRTLGITWSDGLESSYPVRALRLACPCAHCVDELTGQKILNPKAVPEDIRPLRLEAVGLYAIRIRWSDGHDTGLYSFRLLRQLHPRPADTEPQDAAKPEETADESS